MPELAEADYYRKQWNPARGAVIRRVEVHPAARVFRGTRPRAVAVALAGKPFVASAAAAKQMLFRFGDDAWLGVHLGMSGELLARPAGHAAGAHDHLVLRTDAHALVFRDPRMFGRVELHVGAEPPRWWTKIAPAILSADFTPAAVAAFLRRRRGAPIKAVLLMQERFPGVGNWMADEILWRAALHPAQRAGDLRPAEVRALWRECRQVARQALRAIAGRNEQDVPADLNVRIPDTWLFNHRWRDGGRCPRTGVLLQRAEIGGRTSCWSPARQKKRAVGRPRVS